MKTQFILIILIIILTEHTLQPLLVIIVSSDWFFCLNDLFYCLFIFLRLIFRFHLLQFDLAGVTRPCWPPLCPLVFVS